MKGQAELNIGVVGHVDHGKTSLVYSLTGVTTDTHSEEQKRGITIKLGYADAIVHKCEKCGAMDTKEGKKCSKCGAAMLAVKKISFLDAPGHETLMATVIAASSVMDGALFVISATEKCPQPQTLEHLMVLEAAGIKDVVIAQNKVDLVTKEQAKQNYKEIKELVKGSPYETAPIIPVSASTGSNVNVLLLTLVNNLKQKHSNAGEPLMYVARSFDINKPGTVPNKLIGGVIGGSIVAGTIKVGDEIEILPGALRIKKEKETIIPLKTKVIALRAGSDPLTSATCGGLIGISTQLDPALTRADGLVGCVVGLPGKLPKVYSEVTIELTPLKRQVERFADVLVPNEPLVLGVGTATTVGFVLSAKKGKAQLKLKKSVCVDTGQTIAVMRRAKNRWHLYATAKLIS